MIVIPNTPCGYQKVFNSHYNIDFILLHKILDNEEYRNYYLETKNYSKPSQYRILDNSCYELKGKGLGIEEIVEWGQKLAVDEIILPDVYQDKDATLEKIAEAITYLILRFPSQIPFKLQAIPQGKDQGELQTCLGEILGLYGKDRQGFYPLIRCIGINKLWKIDQLSNVLKYNVQINPWIEYHKLGTNNISDWFRLPFNYFRSADSRVLSKLVVGCDDIWEEKLDNSQKFMLANMIAHFDSCGFNILKTNSKKAFNDPVEAFDKRK